MFMESELMYGDKGEVPEDEYFIDLGLAHVDKEGKDVTLVGFGKIMKVVHAAAAELEQEGINAEVIYLRTVRPIDYATVMEAVRKTNRLLLIQESWPPGNIYT